MKTFRLDQHVWTVEPNCLTVRAAWWSYAIGCVIALAVLSVPIVIVRSVITDPSITVNGSRHGRGTEISWAQQTSLQRAQHLACLGCILVPITLFALVYLIHSTWDLRNPLTFDKSTNQIRKGKRVLATLSAVTSVAVVFANIIKPASRTPTQIFIRFNAEPWSFQFLWYYRSSTADRVAAELAEFLSVPIVHDPFTMARPSRSYVRGR